MYRLFALLALVMLASAASARMAATWATMTESHDFPGIAFAASDGGEVTGLASTGVRLKGVDDPIAENTPFLIGSISKSFTALAIMQLVDGGQVSLDAPLADYLPEFDTLPAGKITVHQLLNHTSGFSIVQGNMTQTDLAEDEAALARRVEGIRNIVPENAPGQTHQYSNLNYQLLGRIVETVSGMNYRDYVEQNILLPAGMEDSFVHPSTRSDELAQGHRPWFGSFRALDENKTGAGSAPQGGVAASARDMARYLALMMNGEDDILSAAGKAQMMRTDDTVSPEYGYGWYIDSDKGRVWHSGANPGYDAFAEMLPNERKGAVVLINAGSGLAFGNTEKLRRALAAEALGLDPPEIAEQTPFKVVFFALCVLPFLFLYGVYRAWLRRDRARKNGVWQMAGFWITVALALALAWALVIGLPRSFGANLAATRLFLPDFGLLLTANAVAAVVWALARIGFRLVAWREPRRS